MGIAGFPRDGNDMNELVHQADLAVYRAKLQGRNRVLDASDEPLLAQPEKRGPRLVSLPAADARAGDARSPAATEIIPDVERRQAARPHTPRRRASSRCRGACRCSSGSSACSAPPPASPAAVFGHSTDIVGLVTIIVLVGARAGALARGGGDRLDLRQRRRCARGRRDHRPARRDLPLAITMSAVEWSARRAVFHQLLFNVGALSLASLAAAGIFSVHLVSGALGDRRLRRVGPARRPRLLRRQHRPRLDRGRRRGPREPDAASGASASRGSSRTTPSTASSPPSSTRRTSRSAPGRSSSSRCRSS